MHYSKVKYLNVATFLSKARFPPHHFSNGGGVKELQLPDNATRMTFRAKALCRVQVVAIPSLSIRAPSVPRMFNFSTYFVLLSFSYLFLLFIVDRLIKQV